MKKKNSPERLLRETLAAAALFASPPSTPIENPAYEISRQETKQEANDYISQLEKISEKEDISSEELAGAFNNATSLLKELAEQKQDISAELMHLYTNVAHHEDTRSHYLLARFLLDFVADRDSRDNPTEAEVKVILEIFEDQSPMIQHYRDAVLGLLKTDHPQLVEDAFYSEKPISEYLVGKSDRTEFETNSTDPNQKYLQDENLVGIDQTAEMIERHSDESYQEYVERVLYIQRYLSFRDIEITPESIEAAEKAIEKTKEKWGDYELFSGTTIVGNGLDEPNLRFSAGNRDIQSASDRTLISKPENLSDSSDEQFGSLIRTKYEILNNIAGTDGRMSVVLYMHGAPDHISVGTVEMGNITITAEDIVKAFTRKFAHNSKTSDAENPDVLILANCFSGSLAMKIIEGLREANVPLPIIVTMTEAGQIGYGSLDKGSRLAIKLFEKEKPTISDLYDVGLINEIKSNPIVLVPDETGLTPTQVAANEGDQGIVI